MRPDALPVQAARSHAVLPPDAVAALFGEGYTWRGTERVEVLGAGRPLFVEARPGDPLRLVLDALDREALRASSPTLRGPRGALDAPAIGPIAPRLVLPTGLRDAWGLTDGVTTSVALGPLVLSHVRVETGEGPRVVLDRTVLLAAGTEAGTTARWLGSKGSVESARPAASSASLPSPNRMEVVEVEGRVVTENDVRRARLQHKKIVVRPDQIVTPAARSLGRELGVFAA